MKKLNIELNVHRMQAQSILTTSTLNAGTEIHGNESVEGLAPARQGAGSVPVRAGF